ADAGAGDIDDLAGAGVAEAGQVLTNAVMRVGRRNLAARVGNLERLSIDDPVPIGSEQAIARSRRRALISGYGAAGGIDLQVFPDTRQAGAPDDVVTDAFGRARPVPLRVAVRGAGAGAIGVGEADVRYGSHGVAAPLVQSRKDPVVGNPAQRL